MRNVLDLLGPETLRNTRSLPIFRGNNGSTLEEMVPSQVLYLA